MNGQNCWADGEAATLFGAWGPIEQGYEPLVETLRWVGSRFKSGQPVSRACAHAECHGSSIGRLIISH